MSDRREYIIWPSPLLSAPQGIGGDEMSVVDVWVTQEADGFNLKDRFLLLWPKKGKLALYKEA